MTTKRIAPSFAATMVLSAAFAASASSQSGGFIATLGTDTVHLERFTFENGAYHGTIVTRVPQTRVARYTLVPGANGGVSRYEVATFDASGTPIKTNGSAGSMMQTGDSLVRVSLKDGVMDTVRMLAAKGAVPSPSLPYVGTSYLAYEAAFAAMRARADSGIVQLTMIPQQLKPGSTRAWFVGADSAELDYFGVARSGYKFDNSGKLLRADWRNTTYRYRITRIPLPEVDALASRWAAADVRGAGLGALSPHDTARSSANGADFTIEYSRPSKRGRNVWGTVVETGKVWRLGADFATHFTTTKDLKIGDADVPAGTYTVWMLLSSDTEAKLIINKKTQIFGTQYNPANDLVRVPMTRSPASETEKLTLAVKNGFFEVQWDNSVWRVPVVVK